MEKAYRSGRSDEVRKLECIVISDAEVLLSGELIARVIHCTAAHRDCKKERFLPVSSVDSDENGFLQAHHVLITTWRGDNDHVNAVTLIISLMLIIL